MHWVYKSFGAGARSSLPEVEVVIRRSWRKHVMQARSVLAVIAGSVPWVVEGRHWVCIYIYLTYMHVCQQTCFEMLSFFRNTGAVATGSLDMHVQGCHLCCANAVLCAVIWFLGNWETIFELSYSHYRTLAPTGTSFSLATWAATLTSGAPQTLSVCRKVRSPPRTCTPQLQTKNVKLTGKK